MREFSKNLTGIVQRVDYISDALGFRVAATNLPVHLAASAPAVAVAVPAETVEAVAVPAETAEAVQPTEAPVTDAPALPVTDEPIEVPPAYTVDLRDALAGLEAVDAVPAAVDAVPATVVAREEQVVIPAQQVVIPAQQIVQTVAAPYAGHIIAPGYSADYAQVYQPYAATFGYYYNPSYAATSGALTHSQYHAQDEIGQYNYGFATADSSKSEIKTADGVVQGSYSYVDANGVLQTTNYVSDALGFRVAATNLPVAVAAPEQTA